MNENFPSDVKLNENPDGTVSFASEVIATIAGLAATEVDGVASMVAPSSGLADMFSRKNTRNFTKGVRIDLDENRVTVDITIVVDYGFPMIEVAKNLQENVKKAIETMTGLEVRSVDIHVVGISFEREQKANAELDAQHRKMLERNAEAKAEEAVAPEEAAGEEADNDDDVDFEEEEEDEDYDEEYDDDEDEDIDDEEYDDDEDEDYDDEEDDEPSEADPATQPESKTPYEDDGEDYISAYEGHEEEKALE